MVLKKILIVDDEMLLCWSLKRKLENYGFQVMTADNGEKALDILKNVQFDAILTDLKLPGVNGITIIKTARMLYPEIRTFVMSAFSEEKMQIIEKKEEYLDFFDKPFDLDEVSNLIAYKVQKH